MDKYGFPRSNSKQKKLVHGYRTGDIVKAIVPLHLKNAGTHEGRMSAKAKGDFTIATSKGRVTDIGKQYCHKLQRADGYGYSRRPSAFVSSPKLLPGVLTEGDEMGSVAIRANSTQGNRK
jgi:hypothetical protein